MNKTNISLGIAAGILVSMIMLIPLGSVDFSKVNEQSTGYIEYFLASAGGIMAMVLVYRQIPEFKFAQIIKAGVATSAITALTLFVAMVIYFKAINPEYLSNHITSVTMQRAAAMTDEAKKAAYIADMQHDMNTYTNPFIYSLFIVIPTFMISLMPIAIFGYILFRIYRVKKAIKK